MGKGSLFLKKRKVTACFLAAILLIGEILQPAGSLKAEEVTVSGIEITVTEYLQGTGEKSASGGNLQEALANLSIALSNIKVLTITGGQIKSSDWTYIFNNSTQFNRLTDFRVKGTVSVEDIIPDGFVGSEWINGSLQPVHRRFPDSIERVEIPDGITSIGSNVFDGCKNLTKVTIPGSVRAIGDRAFERCDHLVEISLPEGLETIGTQAFYNCTSLQSIIIPEHMTTIGEGAFASCSGLKEVTFPRSLQSLSLGGYADYSYFGGSFANCTSLTKVEIPGNVKIIGRYAFANCSSIEEIVIEEGVEMIGKTAFQGTAVRNIEIPSSIKTISAYAFNNCSKLEGITISEGVENIGIYAFANCDSLTELTVPASVKLLPPFAFDNCSKLSVLKLFLKSEEQVTAINTHVTTEDLPYGPFENCAASRRMYFYTEEGLPLSASTVPTFSDAVSAYKAEKDDDTSDNLWWGWQMEEAYSVVSHLTNLTGSNKAALWRENDKDYTTTLTPKASTGSVAYTLPQSVVVKIGDRTASSGEDYTYDPATGTLLIKASSIDGNIEIEAAAGMEFSSVPTASPTPIPTLDPTPDPDTTPSPVPVQPTSPAPDLIPKSTPIPTPVPNKDVSDIADGLGVSGETAQKIQEAAKELDVAKDTILVTDQTITSQKTDDDVKGAYFARIQARVSQITENNIKLVWNKVKGADGYLVYGNRCNTKKLIYEYKLAKTITNSSKRSYIQRKCKKGNYYKFIVRAYKNIDGKKVTIAVSKTIHVVTNGGKNGNAGSVKVNKGKVSLKKGKTFQIKAKEIKQKKKLQYHRKVCYESSNPKVASVSKKGVIKAKKKGKCNVFVYAQSGIYKKVVVTVK